MCDDNQSLIEPEAPSSFSHYSKVLYHTKREARIFGGGEFRVLVQIVTRFVLQYYQCISSELQPRSIVQTQLFHLDATIQSTGMCVNQKKVPGTNEVIIRTMMGVIADVSPSYDR
jgi:hypothetical protein